MIADIMSNKKCQAILKELFIRCRKLNISLVFITQSYFSVPKDVRLNSKYFLVMKISNKKELQNIAKYYKISITIFWGFTENIQEYTTDNKIKANPAQYDLDKLAAKISAYSSSNLRKYEYLTGEDLGYKPSVLEQVKFDYFSLGRVFTKGLDFLRDLKILKAKTKSCWKQLKTKISSKMMEQGV